MPLLNLAVSELYTSSSSSRFPPAGDLPHHCAVVFYQSGSISLIWDLWVILVLFLPNDYSTYG